VTDEVESERMDPLSTDDFDSEDELVHTFCTLISDGRSALGVIHFVTEFDYRRGRPDVIAAPAERKVILSFEAKLSRWKVALRQAARNHCFAHFSYVVLPARVWLRVSRHADEFKRKSVGVCTVGASGLSIEIPACHAVPVLPYLSVAATGLLESDACRLLTTMNSLKPPRHSAKGVTGN
jgi:hypothetical protein